MFPLLRENGSTEIKDGQEEDTRPPSSLSSFHLVFAGVGTRWNLSFIDERLLGFG